jgi:hypothetical protein
VLGKNQYRLMAYSGNLDDYLVDNKCCLQVSLTSGDYLVSKN